MLFEVNDFHIPQTFSELFNTKWCHQERINNHHIYKYNEVYKDILSLGPLLIISLSKRFYLLANKKHMSSEFHLSKCYSDVALASWRLGWPGTRLFVQWMFQTIKENITTLHYWPYCEGNSSVTNSLLNQKASGTAESVSKQWRHHTVAICIITSTSSSTPPDIKPVFKWCWSQEGAMWHNVAYK